ncbi:MAG TPA: hypothetical protein VMI53_09145, partial [Opitutaceae bacterium]|nr:hypothetical protein [Opitutaceae bacterium]
MKKRLLPLLAFVSTAALSSYGAVYFQNNGTKEGWPNYPQKPEAKGTISDVTSPVYHSTSAIKFTQTFEKNYTGRYHSEVD